MSIGMHCYMDDMYYDLMTIGNHVTISYGAYFAFHGKTKDIGQSRSRMGPILECVLQSSVRMYDQRMKANPKGSGSARGQSLEHVRS